MLYIYLDLCMFGYARINTGDENEEKKEFYYWKNCSNHYVACCSFDLILYI